MKYPLQDTLTTQEELNPEELETLFTILQFVTSMAQGELTPEEFNEGIAFEEKPLDGGNPLFKGDIVITNNLSEVVPEIEFDIGLTLYSSDSHEQITYKVSFNSCIAEYLSYEVDDSTRNLANLFTYLTANRVCYATSSDPNTHVVTERGKLGVDEQLPVLIDTHLQSSHSISTWLKYKFSNNPTSSFPEDGVFTIEMLSENGDASFNVTIFDGEPPIVCYQGMDNSELVKTELQKLGIHIHN